ncbi:MAG: S9 family peptidase [Acidobacteriota bacterium]|nr:S9 family peptidase [Acidobacteriota bacterium]
MKVMLVLIAVLQLQAARFEIAHMGKIARVSDPQIAPDGKSIVVVVSRANFQENRHEAELVLVDTATGGQHVLTRQRRSVSFPRWSPAGDRLAFLAEAGGKPQVFVMTMFGGDAQQITKVTAGVQQYAWSPDGTRIAYAASEEPPKREGEEKFNDSFEVGNNDFLVTAAPLSTHLWVIASDGGEPRRLTSGGWTLPISHPPSSPASPIAWSPDGKSIAFVKVAGPYSGDGDQSTIQILDVATGAARPLTGRAKNEGYPSFSPDGKSIAFWFPRDGQTKNGNEIYLTPVGGGEGSSLTRALDRNLARAIWMPDGKSLLVGGNDATTVGLWIQPLDGPAKRIDLGKICPSSAFWVDVSVGPHGEIAFTGSEPAHPAELYYMSSANKPVKRVTEFNKDIDALELGKTETLEWTFEGYHEDGVLTYPPDFAAGKKYALVLLVHGGPRAASHDAWSSMAQLMAARGWVVFEPNYRGSDNLGNAYQSAIANDAGAGPGRDVMAAVDLIKKRGFVDESRMAVSGWSYGGYMTTWLLGHYPVWKVAVAGAAVTDWLDQYNLGDSNVRRGSAFGGSPWTGGRMKAYIDQSPITYADKIKAPTLIMSDTGDYRVTITQSYKLYHVLKDNGVTTKFIAYPVAGHSPSDPVRARDRDRRWIAWLSDYLDPL